MRWAGKSEVFRVVLLAQAVAAFFLPWINVQISTLTEQLSTRNYGYHYIVLSNAALVAPLALLSLTGIIIGVVTARTYRRARLASLLVGVLIIAGVAASFAYTFGSAMSRVAGSSNFSVTVLPEYGAGLEILFAVLLILSGVLMRRFEMVNGLEKLSPTPS